MSQSLVIDLRVADPRWAVLGDVDAFAARVMAAAAAETARTGEVSILFTDDAEMRVLNRTWRRQDKPTDVLSFPASVRQIPAQAQHLGDLAVGYDTAVRDAEAMDRPFAAHAAHLLVHGFLHLLGYDHIRVEDAQVMEPLETKILAGLGWPDPYATGPYAGGPAHGRAGEG